MTPFVKRHLQHRLLAALGASPVVFLNGPRQAGKSTLVRALAKKDFPATYVTFDSTTQIAAATSAPEHYLRARDAALIIDEVQLVPEIFRALKTVVDELRHAQGGPVHGRFLLTGSANIMALPKLSDPLVGRMAVLTLYPLSSAEVAQGKGNFIDRLFAQNFSADTGKQKLTDMICAATFPEITGADATTRANWFDGYVTTILQRDVRALADIQKLNVLPNLLRILASRAGGLVNDADIARDAGLTPMTSRSYKTLFNMLFLTFDVAPWYRNTGKRLVKSPKTYISDTLLLCHLLQYDVDVLAHNRPEIFGHVLENFVATELIKLRAYHTHPVDILHFRTSDNKEVDFVLAQPSGKLAGIEVKKRDYLEQADFKGLLELQALAGQDFACGIVLYCGRDIVPFGKNLWAVPISNLWG